MSQICIIKNALDQTEQATVNSENPFKVFLDIKAIHPKAKIYLGNPCPESTTNHRQSQGGRQCGVSRL